MKNKKNIYFLFICILGLIVFLPSKLYAAPKIAYGGKFPDKLTFTLGKPIGTLYAYSRVLGNSSSAYLTEDEMVGLKVNKTDCDYNDVIYYWYHAGANKGEYSSTSPGEGYVIDKSNKKVKCPVNWADKESKYPITQSPFHSSQGHTGFCVHPGKRFNAADNGRTVYYKHGEWDTRINACEKSGDEYLCSLVGVAEYIKKNYPNDSYLTYVIALRLITAAYGEGYGWWDEQTNTLKPANYYVKTYDAIVNAGYSGGSSITGMSEVLWAEDQVSLAALQHGIAAVKAAIPSGRNVAGSGFKLWKPEAKVLKTSQYDRNTGSVTVTIESNFAQSSENIKKVTAEGLGDIPVTNIKSCGSSSGKYCFDLTFRLSYEKFLEFQTNVTIEYFHKDDIITRVALYQHGEEWQNIVIFGTDDMTSYVTFPIRATAPICSYDPDSRQWYDIDGNPTTYEGYKESCECVEVDGRYYASYPSDPFNSYEEYEDACLEKEETCPPIDIEYEDVTDPNDPSGKTPVCKDGDSGDDPDGTIKDPPLCTILSREDVNYKTNYGNEYCDIYCRETLEFKFMTKEETLAGRYFQHNVKAKYPQQEYLSTVILSTRQCGSIIKYDKWKKAYESINDRVRTAWNEYKRTESQVDHTEAISKSAVCPGCSGCTECCNCSDCYCETDENGDEHCDTCCDDGPGGSSETMTWTDYKWPGSLHGITDKDGNHEVGDASGTSTGGYSCSCDACTGTDNSSWDGTPPKLVNNYDAAVAARRAHIDKIKSCNLYKDADGFSKGVMSYKPQPEVDIDYEENYGFQEYFAKWARTSRTIAPTAVRTESYGYVEFPQEFDEEGNLVISDKKHSELWQEYCTECEDELLEDALPKEPYEEHLLYWECTGEYASAICVDKTDEMFPKNLFAVVQVDSEAQFYQGTQYYTRILNGDLMTNPGNGTIKLGTHAYPVAFNRLTGNYGITVEYSELGDPDRNIPLEDGDLICSYDVINKLTIFDCDDPLNRNECYECPDGKYCYPDETTPNDSVGMGVYFRTIDLKDVFPNSQYSPSYAGNITSSRKIGENWATSRGKSVVKEIQNLENQGEGVWSTEPRYKVTLTPDARNKIRKQNLYKEKIGGYLNYSLNCNNNLQCTSDFLKYDLRDIMQENYIYYYIKDTTVSKNKLYYYTK